jgi:alpha-ketoglutarate-dependent taurine dioxygenase
MPTDLTLTEIRDTLRKDGFCHFPLGSTAAALNMAQTLGTPVPVRRGGPIVQELRPMSNDQAHPRSLSAVHGSGAFPMHTDGAHHQVPPRYLVMRCADPGQGSRPTLVADWRTLRFSDADLRVLRRAVFAISGGARPFLASIITDHRDGTAVRFDAGCMRPAHSSFRPAATLVEAAVALAAVSEIFWKAGEGLIIDNWRCFHARGTAVAPDPVRLLERITVATGLA